MKKTIFLLILLAISFHSFAPNAAIDKRIETKDEPKIIKVQKVETIDKLDSAALVILDQYRRDKSDAQHKAFIIKIKLISDSLEIRFPWLVGIMHHESRFNPKALNKINAVGLIQFLPATARGLGTTTNKLYNMTDVEQLDYVYEFYKHAKGKMIKATDLYLYAFFPIAILNKWPNSKVISSKGLSAKTIARHNPGLDLNKNGLITVGEFRKVAYRHCFFTMYKTKKVVRPRKFKPEVAKVTKIPIVIVRDTTLIVDPIKPIEIKEIKRKVDLRIIKFI